VFVEFQIGIGTWPRSLNNATSAVVFHALALISVSPQYERSLVAGIGCARRGFVSAGPPHIEQIGQLEGADCEQHGRQQPHNRACNTGTVLLRSLFLGTVRSLDH
jgi:hypothetical protein